MFLITYNLFITECNSWTKKYFDIVDARCNHEEYNIPLYLTNKREGKLGTRNT
jgi:hypothetical protein